MTDEQINQRIETVLHRNEHWIISRDYCTDLNAMHEAEESLTDDQLWRMARNIERNDEQWYFRATARQRAEAFLRTLGKWEEEQA
jgi:hypothetical protein